MKIRIQRIDKSLELPRFAKKEDAAFDLRSSVSTILKSMQKEIIPTGIKIGIPKKHVGLIWDRSGLAAKHGIRTLAGVIDSGYRGEVNVVLINLGKEDVEITKGMRIAQMIVQPVLNTEIEEVEELEISERGESGFGSTGAS